MKVLVFAGALRAGSFNRKLARVAASELSSRGVEVDLLDLREIDMPLYDGDLEQASGLPRGAVAFRERIAAAEGLFVASPEYNNGVPGTLKNAIDWASRPPSQPFRGKIVALGSASTGPYGGVRALAALRPTFRVLGALVLSPEISIARAEQAFDEGGALREESHRKQLAVVLDELVRVTRALSR